MNLKYFKYEEFKSPDLPDSGNLMDATFLAMLDSAREIAGIPFKINSAYRSESHNRKVGGKSTSSHLVGKAVDLHCTDSRSRWIIITALQKAGFTLWDCQNVYTRRFRREQIARCHLDILAIQ